MSEIRSRGQRHFTPDERNHRATMGRAAAEKLYFYGNPHGAVLRLYLGSNPPIASHDPFLDGFYSMDANLRDAL